MKYTLGVMSLLGVIMLFFGCSAGNKESSFNADTGRHASGWPKAAVHGAATKTQADGFFACQECHGSDFSGGITAISCFSCHGVSAPHSPAPWRGGTLTHTNTDTGNAAVCALCHTNGANSSVQPSPPAPAGAPAGCFNKTLCHEAVGHPAGWSASGQHGVAAEQDFSVCKTCHGPTYNGGTAATTCYQCHGGPGLNHPASAWVISSHKTAALTDIVVCKKCHGTTNLGGGSHIACNSCHMENESKVHRISWYPDVRFNHSAYAKANGTSTCSNSYCHGPSLAGVTQSGPSCTACHVWPLTLSNCATCHGTPPSGAVFPNIAGRHSAHAALGSNIVCTTCHAGAGSGTALHINNVANVIFDPAYNAKTGTAVFNAASSTCSSVSCHGGQTTPNWLTAAIDVNTQCTACHASGTAQYNSYSSGEHTKHVNGKGFACTVCHDTTKLAVNHFATLNTPVMEGPASATLRTQTQYNGTSCNPNAGGLSGCHGSKNW